MVWGILKGCMTKTSAVQATPPPLRPPITAGHDVGVVPPPPSPVGSLESRGRTAGLLIGVPNRAFKDVGAYLSPDDHKARQSVPKDTQALSNTEKKFELHSSGAYDKLTLGESEVDGQDRQSVESLRLCFRPSQAQIQRLSQLPNLIRLDLSSGGLGTYAGAALPPGLFPAGLKELNLSHNPLVPAAGESLSNPGVLPRGLEILNLSHTRMGPAGAEAFAKADIFSPGLKSFDVSSNYIFDQGVEALSASGIFTARLEVLNLNKTGIKHKAAEALSAPGALSSKLRILNLGENLIGLEGAKALSRMGGLPPALETLDLSYNRIGPMGAALLTARGVLPQSLTELDLRVNKLGNDVVDSLNVPGVLPPSTKLHASNNDLTPRDIYGFNPN